MSIFGTEQPIFDSTELHQTYMDTCVIKSQQLILNAFGKDISEQDLVDEAMSLQIYQPGYGTPINHMGDLLELHGVESTMFESANKYTLMHELAQGHQVMVAVDSDELWTPSFWNVIKDFFFGETPNHALIVTGIDTTDPENIDVILTDPGTGSVARYPYNQFADAWSDSSFTMLATNESPVEIENGILDTIMGMDTSVWMQTCGDMISAGVEVAEMVIDYLHDNPEIVSMAAEVLPFFLANNADAAAEAGICMDSSCADMI